MGSELAVIERLNQIQVSLDKVERILSTIVTTTAQAKQTAEPGYLKLSEASVYLNTPDRTLRKWLRTKGLPYHKPGKTLLFRTKDIEAWMNRYRKGLRGLALYGFVDRMGR